MSNSWDEKSIAYLTKKTCASSGIIILNIAVAQLRFPLNSCIFNVFFK